MILTEDGVLSASGLACPPIHIEVGMPIWSPLPQNAGTCVYHIYKVGVRRVKVMGPVVPHEEQDGGIQPCENMEPCHVILHTVRKPVNTSVVLAFC